MRFLIKATIPVEAGNALIRDPRFSKRMEEIVNEIKPEAVYFAVEAGQRTIYFVKNLTDASGIPAIGEPLWLALNAKVEFIPALTEKEFWKAGSSIERAAKKY
jgi:hypothetical protein